MLLLIIEKSDSQIKGQKIKENYRIFFKPFDIDEN